LSLLTELRYPTTRRAKLITAGLAVLFFWLLATVSISSLLLYRILSPSRTGSSIDPTQLLGHAELVSFPAPGGGQREGWLFLGLRGAPTVVLCHGYQSDRGQILTLVSALQENRFNVFLFDFSGHGGAGGTTTLGFREAEEAASAIRVLAERNDLDTERFGLWGTDLGAYAALSAATREPRVRAVVAGSAYANPLQMLQLQIDRSGMGVLPLVQTFAALGFRVLNFGYRNEPSLVQRLRQMEDVHKLFIEARDQPSLAEITTQLYLAALEPREQAVVARAYAATLGEADKRPYEDMVTTFFLQHMSPLAQPPPRRPGSR
jgi:pimeloyl-ACP methyl ester carboxylesterase